MAARRRVLVAGAGVLGLASALALADAGFAVEVHDPAAPADNASGVAAGMLAPAFEAVLDASARPHFALLAAARDLWPAFAGRAGIELDRTAALAVGGAGWIAEVARQLTGLGVQAHPIARAALEAAAPGLAADLREGLKVEGDWRIDAPRALAALRQAGQDAGVTFRRAAAPRGAGYDLTLVATGASRSLADLAPELSALTPIKGHILRAPGSIRHVLRGEGIYAVPSGDGVLLGATMEPGRDDITPDPAQVDRLRNAAARLFPALANRPVQAAVGVRAAAPDGLPLVGPSVRPGVLLAAGARRNGWLLAPLVARAVVAWAQGGEPDPTAVRLAPARFSPPD
jgi:glycine oxidase